MGEGSSRHGGTEDRPGYVAEQTGSRRGRDMNPPEHRLTEEEGMGFRHAWKRREDGRPQIHTHTHGHKQKNIPGLHRPERNWRSIDRLRRLES